MRFPINLEEAFVKALLLFGLPLVVSPRWRDQIDPILLLTLDKLLSLCIIGVGEMLCGHQILFFERLMDYRRHIHIPVARSTRLDMGNQSGSIFITTFAQVHLLPHPPRGQFAPVGRLDIIRGADHFGWGRNIVVGAEVGSAFDEFKLLDPHAPQDLSRPNVP